MTYPPSTDYAPAPFAPAAPAAPAAPPTTSSAAVQEISRLRNRVAELEAEQARLHEQSVQALVLATNTAETLISEAHQESQRIVREARDRGQAMVSESAQSLRDAEARIERLHTTEREVRARLKGFLNDLQAAVDSTARDR